VVMAKTGSGKDMYDAILKFIKIECNGNGHRVRVVHADADTVFRSLSAMFGSMVIKLQLAPPGHHAKLVERNTETFNERKRILGASLPFRIPPEFGLDCFQDLHVAYTMRNLVCSKSYPNTPAELVQRQRAALTRSSIVPYQAVCAIRMGIKKRQAIATKHMVHLQQVPMTEIAVCLGRADDGTPAAHHFFVHSTMKVVSRRNFTMLNSNIIPAWAIPCPRFKMLHDPTKLFHDPFLPDNSLPNAPIQLEQPPITPPPCEQPLVERESFMFPNPLLVPGEASDVQSPALDNAPRPVVPTLVPTSPVVPCCTACTKPSCA
jgi:hypothetical protein